MKALIPAAGLGTRYLPLTKAVPKELIPVDGLPVIHHVVAEAKEAGCRDIGIIVSKGKDALREYFTWNEPLMLWLEAKGKRHHMAEWEALMEGLRFSWIDQPEQLGLGHAISCGEAFAEGQPVCILLGDTIMQGGSPLPGMVHRYQETGQSQVAVEPVSAERATRYGVCGGQESTSRAGTFDLDCMIEKPRPGEIPTMRGANGIPLSEAYAFAARYVLSPSIFQALRATSVGRNNEIQLTDAMRGLLESEGFGAIRLPGIRVDVGSPETSLPPACSVAS